MNTGVLVLSLILAVCIQGILPEYAFFAGAGVPVVVGVVVYYALTRNASLMFIAAMLGGIFVDGMSRVPFGCSSVCFVLTGGFVRAGRDWLLVRDGFKALVFGGVAGAFYSAGVYMFLRLFGSVSDVRLSGAFLHVLGSGFLGMIATPVVFMLMLKFDRLVGNVAEPDDK